MLHLTIRSDRCALLYELTLFVSPLRSDYKMAIYSIVS